MSGAGGPIWSDPFEVIRSQGLISEVVPDRLWVCGDDLHTAQARGELPFRLHPAHCVSCIAMPRSAGLGIWRTHLVAPFDDSLDVPIALVEQLGAWVGVCLESGVPVVVHCAAGLNRSALVAGIAMMDAGVVSTGALAVRMLRARRSPSVLCNAAFERYLVTRHRGG